MVNELDVKNSRKRFLMLIKVHVMKKKKLETKLTPPLPLRATVKSLFVGNLDKLGLQDCKPELNRSMIKKKKKRKTLPIQVVQLK